MKTVAIAGPLDTKGEEYQYLKECLMKEGLGVVVIDLGTGGRPLISADISSDEVAGAVNTTIKELRNCNDRTACIEAMGKGAARIVFKEYQEKKIHGIIAMGGGQTTSMCAEVMRKLPVGMPKVLVSTLATSVHSQQMFEGINDTFVINPLVDVAGLNSILKMVIEHAAQAMAGILKGVTEDVEYESILKGNRPCIAVSMWGVTTKCVTKIRSILESRGFEVLVFHATGLGGSIMEKLIEQGQIAGVMDVTLPEFSNPILGGAYPENPKRLKTAGRKGLPQIIVPGGFDMIMHVAHTPVPEKFMNRQQYLHNPSLLFFRSSEEENRLLGERLADVLNKAKGNVQVFFPMKGLSAYDINGGPFCQPQCDRALKEALERNLRPEIPFTALEYHINDTEFAVYITEKLLELLRNQ